MSYTKTTPTNGHNGDIGRLVQEYAATKDPEFLGPIYEFYRGNIKRLVIRLLACVPMHAMSIEDGISLASMAFIESMPRYVPSPTTDPFQFAYKRMKGAILDELRENSILSRSQLRLIRAYNRLQGSSFDGVDIKQAAKQLDVTEDTLNHALSAKSDAVQLNDLLYSENAESTHPIEDSPQHAALLDRQKREFIKRAMQDLPPDDKITLMDYFYRGMTLLEIAQSGDLGREVGETRASQLLFNARARLRDKLKPLSLSDLV